MVGGDGKVSGAVRGWNPDIEITGRLGNARSVPEEAKLDKDRICLGSVELRVPMGAERESS